MSKMKIPSMVIKCYFKFINLNSLNTLMVIPK